MLISGAGEGELYYNIRNIEMALKPGSRSKPRKELDRWAVENLADLSPAERFQHVRERIRAGRDPGAFY